MNQFQTLKSDLTKSRIINEDLPTISNGEILLKIESFAFTANNVTYGVASNSIGNVICRKCKALNFQKNFSITNSWEIFVNNS